MGQGYPDLEWFDHCIREKDAMHIYPVSTGKVWTPKIHGLFQETINLVLKDKNSYHGSSDSLIGDGLVLLNGRKSKKSLILRREFKRG